MWNYQSQEGGMVLGPMSMCARGFGSSQGPLHTPSTRTQKKKCLEILMGVGCLGKVIARLHVRLLGILSWDWCLDIA